MKIKLHTLIALLSFIISLSGCSYPPSLPLLGAAFPDWLYCIAAGAACAGIIFSLAGDALRERYQFNAIGWMLVTTIISSLIWLFLFS
ncbi:YtcA family lipoprotein [Klebsiella aerogenes]|uniref:YtcA family lipoprotein n=1 Tax=Klebsiella aerogenes TaxID=548 RepID=UPI00387ECA45